MERLYKALIGLAVVTLVLGLAIAYLYGTSAFNQFPQSLSTSSADGLMVNFFKTLSGLMPIIISDVSSLLDGGVITLAAALAWVNRRSSWLIALVVLELLALAWPSFAITWQNLYFAPTPAGPSHQQIEIFNLVNLSVPLIPVALALIFALTHRKLAAASEAGAEPDADAALGVVRSAL